MAQTVDFDIVQQDVAFTVSASMATTNPITVRVYVNGVLNQTIEANGYENNTVNITP